VFCLCAWILWSRSYINGDLKSVEVNHAYGTQNECQDGITHLEKDNKKRGKKVEPGIIHWSERQYATLICLPDTVKLK